MMRYAAQKDGVVRMGWIDEADDGRGGTDADEPDRKGLRRASGRGKYHRRAAKKLVMNSRRRICHRGDRGPRRTGGIAYHFAPRSVCGSDHIQNGSTPRFFCTGPEVRIGSTAAVLRLGKSVSLAPANRPSATSNQSSLCAIIRHEAVFDPCPDVRN
jgi:hypothetical protein